MSPSAPARNARPLKVYAVLGLLLVIGAVVAAVTVGSATEDRPQRSRLEVGERSARGPDAVASSAEGVEGHARRAREGLRAPSSESAAPARDPQVAAEEDPEDVLTPTPDPRHTGRLGADIKPPAVHLTGITVEDPAHDLSVATARRAIEDRLDRIASCYFRALAENPNLIGSVSIKADVGTLGTIQSISGGGDVPDVNMIGCVTRVIRKRAIFSPAPSTPTPIEIRLRFSPSG